MTLTITLSGELEQFMQQEISAGQAVDESDFLSKTIQLYRNLKQRHDEMKTTLESSIREAERGETVPLDIEAIINRGRLRRESAE